MAMTPEHFAQLHLQGLHTYQQMVEQGPAYRFLAWLYSEDSAPIPLMAAFGFFQAMIVVAIAIRLLMPKRVHLAADGRAMLIGGAVTMMLVIAQVDTMKVFLVWMLILLGTLIFRSLSNENRVWPSPFFKKRQQSQFR